MPVTLIAVAALLGAMLFAFRAGLPAALACSTALGASAMAAFSGNDARLVGLGVGGSLALLVFLGIALPRLPVLRIVVVSRSLGSAVGLAHGITAVILVAGIIQATNSQARGAVLSAPVYPPIAAAGSRLAAVADTNAVAYAPPTTPDEPDAADTPARPVAWAEAAPYDGSSHRTLTGTVTAAESAPLGFEVDGRVDRVLVRIGDEFGRGDVLATIDTRTLQLQLDERQAALIEAEAMFAEARQEYARQEQLFDRGVAAEARLEDAAAALDSARSRLEVARKGVEQAQDRLEDTRLTAPYAGRVAERSVEPAQLVRVGEPVFEIQSLNGGAEIDVVVPETLIGALELGTRHEAELLDGHEKQVTAELIEIGARANAETGFPVTLEILDADGSARAGLSAEVHFRFGGNAAPQNAVAVPFAAIRPGEGSETHIFVFDPSAGVVRLREVAVATVERELAIVTDGLTPGDVVVTRGVSVLSDGAAVALQGVGIARYDM
ncbi:Multidrug resistance protein MdtA precursor [Roseivivax jejudonensis]|uniref:Multidrug resistance protein MdtA n=1 Tax=Roseivivax jejudonensis TaxID=1529041 RepID=A0A1X7A6B2_9RHOB|nr:efflux RND transporter periplasmic adaptor subunit [Roseivivax jejudonensis]SLN71698.1 Multidrug resistance protein MdtA precursor [Roseivivax jejudonensis]